MIRRALVPLFASLLLAGCGTSEPARTPASEPSAATAAGGPVSVTDSRGKTVTLPTAATRVVTLEWGQTEDVITLGVQPVGVADILGYTSWDTASPITGSPVDVGLRTEPSLESVAKADPDVIIGIEGSVPEGALEQMERIAPVVVLKGANAERPIEQLRENFTAVATLLGRTSQAGTTLAALDAKLAGAKGSLAGKKYVFSYINATGNTVDLRMHSARSLPGAVGAELGLVNAWTEPGDDQWGIGSLDLEGLSTLDPELTLLHWGNAGVDDPTTGVLAKNALWTNLPAVKAGRVHRVAVGVWIYGGPASMMQWVDELTGALGGA